jgi:hypothetical protein
VDELYKYSFQEFLHLREDMRDLYKAFGLRLKPNDWNKGDMLEWEWSIIKQLQDLLNKPYLTYDDMKEIICTASGDQQAKINSRLWYDVFAFYNFVVEGIKRINEVEKQLSYEPDSKEVGAGIEEYNKFGWFVTLDRLAGGDMLKYDAIGKQKFCDVFAKLLLNKVDVEYNKRLMKRQNV